MTETTPTNSSGTAEALELAVAQTLMKVECNGPLGVLPNGEPMRQATWDDYGGSYPGQRGPQEVWLEMARAAIKVISAASPTPPVGAAAGVADDLARMRAAVAEGKTSALCFYDGRTPVERIGALASTARADSPSVTVHNPIRLANDLGEMQSDLDTARERVRELEAALRECQDKLWIARCDSRDGPFREAAERAVGMATRALSEPVTKGQA